MAKVSQIHTAVLIHQVSQACKFWIILTILIITILPLFIKALKNYIYAFWCTILQKQLSRWVENIFAWFWHKVCPIENNTNLNSIFCLIKSSKIDFIFLPAFYLIMWLMTSAKNFEKIAILKKCQLVFYWGVKTYFGEIPLKFFIFRHEIFCLHQYPLSNSYCSHQI